MSSCTCTIEINDMRPVGSMGVLGNMQIAYCPLHKAAPRLLAALEALLTAVESDMNDKADYDDLPCLICSGSQHLPGCEALEARAAIAEARGEG